MSQANRKRTTKQAAARKHAAMRDALPFIKKGRGKVGISWWSVKPSGDYSADLETGMAYAKAFLPMMLYNAGASDLGIIVSHMALAGRKSRDPKHRRGIDNIALGFLFGMAEAFRQRWAALRWPYARLRSQEVTLDQNL